MNDGNPAADAAGPAPVVTVAPGPAAPGGETVDTNKAADAGPKPGADAPSGAIGLEATPAEDVTFPARPTGRVASELERVRDALKARIGGVRVHLADAAKGDHRATVAALTRLTDLVHDMFGPDRPEDSLRGALADLAAGRTEDARTALHSARAVLASETTAFEAGESEAIVAVIDGALHALDQADVAGCSRLAMTALDLVEMGA